MTKETNLNRKYKEFSIKDKNLLAILGIGIGALAVAKKQIVQMVVKAEGIVNYNFITKEGYKSGDIYLSTIKNEDSTIDTQIPITENTVITTDTITKAYRATQKTFHPDKCKEGPLCESTATIRPELDTIRELLLEKYDFSKKYDTIPISTSLTINNLLNILNLSYSKKYQVTYSLVVGYQFKVKGTTTSNNNSNNDLSREQIEANIDKIKKQKESLEEAKKKVEDSIHILNKGNVHPAIAKNMYDQVMDSCGAKKLDQLDKEILKKQEVLTSDQREKYSSLYTKQCKKDFENTYIEETKKTLQQQLKTINKEIENSGKYLILLNNALKGKGNSGSNNNQNNQGAENKANKDAENKAKQEQANKDAESKAKKDAENKAKQEQAKKDAENKAKQEQAKKDAENKAKQEQAKKDAIFKKAEKLFDEKAYLKNHKKALNDIMKQQSKNAFDHFIKKGCDTGFSDGKFDCKKYQDKYSSQMAKDDYSSPYLHCIAVGIDSKFSGCYELYSNAEF